MSILNQDNSPAALPTDDRSIAEYAEYVEYVEAVKAFDELTTAFVTTHPEAVWFVAHHLIELQYRVIQAGLDLSETD